MKASLDNLRAKVLKNSTTQTIPTKTEKLIKEYQLKVERCDKNLERVIELIRDARKDESIDTEDLRGEKANVNRDRQLYIQFIKDLESL